MYNRKLAPFLLQSLQKVSVLTLLGPRQSGKTTLVRQLFPQFTYLSLEDPDERELCQKDPRGFLNRSGDKIIIDEVQRVPELTSYIQTIVDQPQNKKKFVLTGSNGLMLMDTITQTLAGRTELFELYPLSLQELSQKNSNLRLNEVLFSGGYPKIHHENLLPTKWLKNYFQLYVEKDIRQISNITNLDLFERFIRLAAGRVGQLINLASLANEVGVSAPTITKWISALKATFIAFTLTPHFKNFNKRIVKTPKLYFYDTGLLCYLIGVQNAQQLETHPLRGAIFENFVISEKIKQKHNSNQEAHFYFWRDQKGHEIDLVEDCSTHLFPTEIKLSETFNSDFLKNILFLNSLQQDEMRPLLCKGEIIYSGLERDSIHDIKISHWRSLSLD